MGRKEDKMILEEQKILEDLLANIEDEKKALQSERKKANRAKERARANAYTDAYGAWGDAAKTSAEINGKLSFYEKVKENPYFARLQLKVKAKDTSKASVIEIKVGKKGIPSETDRTKHLVDDWRSPVCMQFDSHEETDDYTYGSGQYETTYSLKMHRRVGISSSHVNSVIQRYPVADGDAKEVEAYEYDSFLKELADRRKNSEFRDIITTIQEEQNQIIKRPVGRNMIVQGCAGSGKSMIMLHRLSVLVYNYSDRLPKKSLYIISPSENYNLLSDNLRGELEIMDLNIGTLNQYYEYVLTQKYFVKAQAYGRIDYSVRLTKEQIDYVYGKNCKAEINRRMDLAISKKNLNMDALRSKLNMGTKESNGASSVIPKNNVQRNISEAWEILEENESVLKEYHARILHVLVDLREIPRKLKSRKSDIVADITKLVESENETIEHTREEIGQLNPKKNEVAIKNRQSIIGAAQNRIKALQKTILECENDIEYFDELLWIDDSIHYDLAVFDNFKEHYIDIKESDIYYYISKINSILTCYDYLYNEFESMEEKYLNHCDSIWMMLQRMSGKITELRVYDAQYLPIKDIQELRAYYDYYVRLDDTLPYDTYLSVMKKLGAKIKKDGDIAKAWECSPYIYLQIMFLYAGVPNGTREKMIAIDEAHSLALEELKLIRNVNDGEVIFNLFGDCNQHIEGTQGIDDWKAVKTYLNADMYNLKRNYRNAKEITKYCNRKLATDMQVVDIPGEKVRKIQTWDMLLEILRVRLRREKAEELDVVIVKNEDEIVFFQKLLHEYKDKISDISQQGTLVNTDKWNLITVAQAKGLEFAEAIVCSGNMTRNEKYIAYTRALDRLFVYDKKFEVPSSRKADGKVSNTEVEKDKNENMSRRKRRRKENRGQLSD